MWRSLLKVIILRCCYRWILSTNKMSLDSFDAVAFSTTRCKVHNINSIFLYFLHMIYDETKSYGYTTRVIIECIFNGANFCSIFFCANFIIDLKMLAKLTFSLIDSDKFAPYQVHSSSMVWFRVVVSHNYTKDLLTRLYRAEHKLWSSQVWWRQL